MFLRDIKWLLINYQRFTPFHLFNYIEVPATSSAISLFDCVDDDNYRLKTGNLGSEKQICICYKINADLT